MMLLQNLDLRLSLLDLLGEHPQSLSINHPKEQFLLLEVLARGFG